MTPAEEMLFKKIHLAVCDPGAYVPRDRETVDGLTEYESVTHWSARAVMVALPDYREQIAKEIEAHGEALMAQAVEQVLKDDPQGFSATFRAAAITSVAKIVRGGA